MPSKIYPYLLTILVLIICFQNYAIGSTLMGFDSWHPEFNFSAAFEKSLSVWQEYMGLGTHGPMSFASDLSRNIVLLFFSYFLPVSFLRYLWTFGMLLLGTLGMYYFLHISVFGRDRNYSKDLSFLGALFYLFNLSTLQLFYTSFDGFITQFGFLPWLFWSSKALLDGYSKRNILILILLSFFSSGQGYTGTLFFAFLIFYFLYLLSETLIYPERQKRIYNLVRILIIFFLANFFWLAPVMYAIGSGADYVSKATINLLSSEESFFLNQKYGDLGSILELRNFWFDSTDFNNRFGTFDPLFDDWIKHLSTISSQGIHFFLTIFVLIGLFYSLFVKKYRIFSLMFVLAVFFLTAGKEPFSIPYNFLRDNVPLLKEALRFPFTKFSIVASFIYSVLFAIGISLVLDKLSGYLARYKTADRVVMLVSILFLSLFINRYLPYFEGKLLNPNTKVFLPEEYFRFFKFVQKKGAEERFFLAPANTFWAWPYYDFGYRGSGFIMYGFNQPSISRSFDVWNRTNENIYWEVNFALEKDDPKLLADVIKKYRLKNFVIDRNIVIPGVSEEERRKYSDSLQILLEKTGLVQSKNSFGRILVVEAKIDSGFVSTHQFLPQVSSFEGLKYKDLVYSEIGDYIRSNKSDLSDNKEKAVLPFSYLSSLRVLESKNYEILNQKSQIKLKSVGDTGNFSSSRQNVLYKSKIEGNSLVLSSAGLGGESYLISLNNNPDLIYFDNFNFFDTRDKNPKNLFLNLNSKAGLYKFLSSETYLVNEFYEGKIELDSCTENPSGSFSYQFVNGSLILTSSGNNPSLCLFSQIKKGVFSKNSPVDIKIGLVDGANLNVGFCLYDIEKKKCEVEGVFEKENNYSTSFVPKNDSSDYDFYLLPQINSKNNQKFEISNIFVTKYSFLSNLNLSELPAKQSHSSEEMTFDLRNILVDGDNFVNICPVSKGETDLVSLKDSLVEFSNTRSICLNLLEKTGYFKSNQLGYLAYLNYSLENEKGVSICAGGTKECLTIDKLEPGNNIEKLIIIPKNAKNLRLDLVSITSKKSSFKVNELKIAEVDLEGLSLINNLTPKATNNSKFLNQTRILPWLYFVKKENISDDSRYIGLSQDNQRGWIAFCGSNLCKYEGSLNGFGKVWGTEKNQNIIIIYIPQILLIFGLVLLTILTTYSIINTKNRQRM